MKSSGSVLIHRPSAVCHTVLVNAVFDDVIFRKNIVSHKPAAFPGACHITYPHQLIIVCAVVAAVFDVIPHAVDYAVQFIADVLVAFDDVVPVASQFDPPVTGLDVIFFHKLVFMIRIIFVGTQHYHVVRVVIHHNIAVIAVFEPAFVQT